MKAPIELVGITRLEQSDVLSAALRSDAGFKLSPHDVDCEDTCHQVYEIGSDEHEACLDDCRDSG